MKNIIRNIVVFLVAISSFAALAGAKDLAMVVKQDGAKIYLDISEFKTKPQQGAKFTIEEHGEAIVNPKTGKVLGNDVVRSIKGALDAVYEDYAVGTIEEAAPVLGLDARIEQAPSATHTAFKEPSSATFNEARIMPLWQSDTIEGKTKASAAADINGNGQNELILSFDGDNSINVFTLNDKTLTKLTSAKVNPLRKIISLDASDIKGTGKAQIFATVLDSSSQKFKTLVFEYKENALEITATINGMVKGIAPNNGPRTLYTQDINQAAKKLSYTTPALLTYNGKTFAAGKKLDAYNFNSIYGFNYAKLAKTQNQHVVYTTPLGRVRIQFGKRNENVESPAGMDFSTTPLRIKNKNELDRLFVSLAVFPGEDGISSYIAGVEHKAKLGILSDTFGSYQSAKLHFLKWDGVALSDAGSADIGGVIYDIVQAPLGKYQNTIIVPFTTGAGKTGVMLFEASR